MSILKQHILKREEDLHFVVEGNSKKAVNQIIEEVDKIKIGIKSYVKVIIDATPVKKYELFKILVAFSMHSFRNRHNQVFFQIISNFIPEKEMDYMEEFKRFLRLGGGYDVYTKDENFNAIEVNKMINQEINNVFSSLEEVNNQYENFLSSEIQFDVKEKIDFKRKLNLRKMNVGLIDFYNKCFDEFQKIMFPEHCINVNPSFQRELVWDIEKKKKFIYSLLNDIPIGTFYVNRPSEYDPDLELSEGYGSLLWDGKQRMHTLHSFFLNEFSVEVNGKEYYYFENKPFFTLGLSAYNISIHESSFNSLKEIIEAYVIINSAQVKHTDEDLQKAMDLLKEI